jgi:hypothetical protein
MELTEPEEEALAQLLEEGEREREAVELGLLLPPPPPPPPPPPLGGLLLPLTQALELLLLQPEREPLLEPLELPQPLPERRGEAERLTELLPLPPAASLPLELLQGEALPEVLMRGLERLGLGESLLLALRVAEALLLLQELREATLELLPAEEALAEEEPPPPPPAEPAEREAEELPQLLREPTPPAAPLLLLGCSPLALALPEALGEPEGSGALTEA